MNYGWERLPARTNWRNFFPGVRFNQFVIRDGLDSEPGYVSNISA